MGNNNLVVIVVYNRLENIKKWLHCWEQCVQDSRLVIIHTGEEDWSTFIPDQVLYLKRKNRGFDIGCLQDVCLERLEGFPDNWEKMLWMTDDTFPMQKDFTTPFWRVLKEGYDIAAMKISPFVQRHIRTTGIAFTKETSKKIKFPKDPVITKQECFQFEHKGDAHLLAQFMHAAQVAPDQHSPLYDTGYFMGLRERWPDHFKIFNYQYFDNFKPGNRITIIAPCYNSYPVLAHSLIMQSYPDWELWLIHDGPGEIAAVEDERVKYFHTAERKGYWGHSIRSEYLQKVTSPFVLITNPDNYYAPVYFDYAMKTLASGRYVGAYSGQFIHNYNGYQVIPSRLHRGFIDCGQMLLRTKEAQQVGWKNITDHSADWLFFQDLINAYGQERFKAFNNCTFIHN